MKRTWTVVAAFFFALPLFAEETHRYVVGTRGPAKTAAAVQALEIETEVRGLITFENLDAVSLELTESEANALRRSGNARYVEREVIYEAYGRNVDFQTTPYGITLTNSNVLWSVARGAEVNVAVLDSGLQRNHPDLLHNYAGGFNAFDATSDPIDDHGHGTHVAGTIGAFDNALGVVGVAPNVRLWGVKVLRLNTTSGNASGPSTVIARGIDWVISRKRELGGRWIINMSLGSSQASAVEREACQRAADNGILIFAASGNDSDLANNKVAPLGFPAAFPTVLGVGAVDAKSTIANFSNQGPELDLVAPGVNVLSTARIGTGALSFVTSGGLTLEGSDLAGSPRKSVSGQFVFCELGKPEQIPASVAGKIALIKRGELRFAEKAKNAKERGAIAVVIFNHEDSARNWTLLNEDDPTAVTYEWPLTVGISMQDGQALLNNANAVITVTTRADDYVEMSGTSMATPHAAGIAALVWSVAPDATAEQVKHALLMTAKDLGKSGFDTAFGNGMIDAYAAARQLAPQKFGSGTTVPGVPPQNRRVLRRGP